MDISAQSRVSEEFQEPIIDKLDTQTRHTESREGSFTHDLLYKFRKMGVGDILRTLRPPSPEIGSREDYLFSSARHEIIDFRDDIFGGSRLVPSACLDRQTECAEIITPRLDDDEFLGMKSGPCYGCFLKAEFEVFSPHP